MQVHTRQGKLKKHGKKATHRERQTDASNEGRRWLAGVEQSAAVLQGCPNIIHVMDREADSYAIFAGMLEQGARFVIRCSYDRCMVSDEHDKVGQALDEAPTLQGTREVVLGKRGVSPMPGNRKRHPPRQERLATLAISALTVAIARPKSASLCAEQTLTLNLVRVVEANPPAGESPVEWWLWTTEPIEPPAQSGPSSMLTALAG